MKIYFETALYESLSSLNLIGISKSTGSITVNINNLPKIFNDISLSFLDFREASCNSGFAINDRNKVLVFSFDDDSTIDIDIIDCKRYGFITNKTKNKQHVILRNLDAVVEMWLNEERGEYAFTVTYTKPEYIKELIEDRPFVSFGK